jgi:hypothetical protein
VSIFSIAVERTAMENCSAAGAAKKENNPNYF